MSDAVQCCSQTYRLRAHHAWKLARAVVNWWEQTAQAALRSCTQQAILQHSAPSTRKAASARSSLQSVTASTDAGGPKCCGHGGADSILHENPALQQFHSLQALYALTKISHAWPDILAGAHTELQAQARALNRSTSWQSSWRRPSSGCPYPRPASGRCRGASQRSSWHCTTAHIMSVHSSSHVSTDL